ncbi:MAG: PhoH family protein [Synergistaceae bacterium]|nr:PhoH family protein [Synergistaceae bacterium]
MKNSKKNTSGTKKSSENSLSKRDMGIFIPANSLTSDEAVIVRLLAENNGILSLIEKEFSCHIFSRGDKITIESKNPEIVPKIKSVLQQFADRISVGQNLGIAEVRYALNAIKAGEVPDLKKLYNDVVCVNNRGQGIRPYTEGQSRYIDSIRNNDITFVIGPAGTGKTYLAAAQAVAMLKTHQVSRIILVRPVVEAGERLGYLPGDLNEKISPYLRPLFDSFYELFPNDKFERFFEKGIIELAPLAYMRGRTLNDSFIILDEAQNTTPEQMKMFLTRLGFGSKAVVTGDITQVDLPNQAKSGLKLIDKILTGVPKIAFVYLNEVDIIRHETVARIVKAYEKYEKTNSVYFNN